jgi:hypothetical protein
MFTLVDILYREYCRARLAEMRKQLLISAVCDETLQAAFEDGDWTNAARPVAHRLAADRSAPTVAEHLKVSSTDVG